MWSIAALWVGMAICITTYTLASSLIEQGMNWRHTVLTIFLGNLSGCYHYHGDFSLVAIASLILSVLPNLPGFLVAIKALSAAVAPLFVSLYHYAWLVGFFLYLLGRELAPND